MRSLTIYWSLLILNVKYCKHAWVTSRQYILIYNTRDVHLCRDVSAHHDVHCTCSELATCDTRLCYIHVRCSCDMLHTCSEDVLQFACMFKTVCPVPRVEGWLLLGKCLSQFSSGRRLMKLFCVFLMQLLHSFDLINLYCSAKLDCFSDWTKKNWPVPDKFGIK